MARNQEKAQALLNRFLQQKRDALTGAHQRRPGFAGAVDNLMEAEKWRREILREISRMVSVIQDGSLGEHKIRDLNDQLNKLLRTKRHWEHRIIELGGPNYLRSAPRLTDADGKSAIEVDGYFYFGAARELPGVRELFEQRAAAEAPRTSRAEMYKKIDADYYGFRDDDDGLLEKLEGARERELLAASASASASSSSSSSAASVVDEHDVSAFKSHVPLPSHEDIEQMIVEQRKKALMERYALA